MNAPLNVLRRRYSSFILHPSSFVVIALSFFLAASAALGLEIPPTPKFFYNDVAGLLDSNQAKALNEKLAAFEQRSGVQAIVYVFPSLEGESLEDFSIRCAERWKVGNKKFDNGLILFVFVKERKIRVEVGYGLERTVTDAMSSRVIREYIAPHFKQGDYAGGLSAGVDALIALIEKKEAPVAPFKPRESAGAQQLSCGSLIALLAVIFVIIVIASVITRSRPGCGGCFWPMFFWPGGGGGGTFGGGGFSGGGRGGGGWSGFSSGGGSFGGGGASGGW